MRLCNTRRDVFPYHHELNMARTKKSIREAKERREAERNKSDGAKTAPGRVAYNTLRNNNPVKTKKGRKKKGSRSNAEEAPVLSLAELMQIDERRETESVSNEAVNDDGV